MTEKLVPTGKKSETLKYGPKNTMWPPKMPFRNNQISTSAKDTIFGICPMAQDFRQNI